MPRVIPGLHKGGKVVVLSPDTLQLDYQIRHGSRAPAVAPLMLHAYRYRTVGSLTRVYFHICLPSDCSVAPPPQILMQQACWQG